MTVNRIGRLRVNIAEVIERLQKALAHLEAATQQLVVAEQRTEHARTILVGTLAEGTQIGVLVGHLVNGIRRVRGEGLILAQEKLRETIRQVQALGGDPPAGDAPSAVSTPPATVATAGAIPVPPSFRHAAVDDRKLTDYALSPTHPRGKHKLRVITAATGLGPADADEVRQQILHGAQTGRPMAGRSDEFGQRWTVDMPLTGRKGTVHVRTAWIVPTGETTPRLVAISFPRRKGEQRGTP